MELELATFDLPLAIDNARTFVRERATRHGITLDVKVDEQPWRFRRRRAQDQADTAQSAIQRGEVYSGRWTDRYKRQAGRRCGGNLSQRHRYRHRTGGPAQNLRGVSPSGHRLCAQGRRNGTWPNSRQEVCRAARWQDLGDQRSGQRLDVYFYASRSLSPN